MALRKAILSLIENDDRRLEMGLSAARDASKRFTRDRMICDYLNWVGEEAEGLHD
tara:strand:+ start:3763 stop:3927 length:165 start_codon:yes stop_codon:yes gene_type:complete